MSARRRGTARLLRLGALGAIAAATVALTQVPASGAFSGVTGNAADSVSSAATFCTAPPQTLYSTGDTWTDESSTATNHQSDLDLRVRSSSAGNRHIWTGFALPAVPDAAHCQLVQAQLSFYNKTPSSGRNIDVYRGNPASPTWTAATLTWSNEPASPLGPAATNAATTATPGWQTWNVTAHVLAQYAGGVSGNNGFLLRDRNQGSAASPEQVYYDRQDVTYSPTLVLTWG